MSEELDRKRQRSDDEDDAMYDPSAGELPPHLQPDSGSNGEAYTLPPHEMADAEQQQPERQLSLPKGPRMDRDTRGNHDSHYAKRGRREAPINYELEKASEIMRDLQRMGENPYTLDEEFMNYSGALAYYWADELFRTSMLRFIGASITEFPHKLLQFSVVIILANARNPDVGQSILGWIKDRIEEVFVAGDSEMDGDAKLEPEMINVHGWDRVKLLFRALAVLSSIVADVDNVLKLAEDALNLAVTLQQKAGDVRSPVGEMLMYEFTISIPYLLANDRSNVELQGRCRQLLEVAKQFAVVPVSNVENAPFNSGVTPYSEILSKVAGIVEATLDDVSLFTDFSRILNHGTRSMLEQKAEQDLVMSGNATADSQPTVGDVVTHQLGPISLPAADDLTDDVTTSKSNVDKLWATPRYVVEIFKNESVRTTLGFETLPPLDSYVSLISRDLVEDLVLNVEYNRVTVSRQLLALSSYFNSRLFALPYSSLEKLMIINDLNKSGGQSDLIANLENNSDFPEHVKGPMIESARNIIRDYNEGFTSTWKMDEVYLETVVNLMFMRPAVELPAIYFQSLLMDTSGRDWANSKHESAENDPLTFPKLLGDCFRYLYSNVEEMTHEAFALFVDWFVYQISNFKFEWEWQEWVPDVLHIGAENVFNRKVSFIRNAIHKETLVTSYKLIRNTLPEDFKHFSSLALNDKEALQRFDADFFGEQFAQANTQDPFQDEPLERQYNGGDEPDRIIETNTDAFKLFHQYFFNHHDHIYHDICRDVYMNLESAESSVEDFMGVLARLRESIVNTPDEQRVIANADQYVVTLVMHSICLIGSRSFSVLQEGLKNLFGGKIRAVMDSIQDPSKGVWATRAVLRLWVREPRIGMLFLSKLVGYAIEPADVVKAGWLHVVDGVPVPALELWMDQFLDRYMLDGDMLVYRETLLETYFNSAAKVMNAMGANGNETGKAAVQAFLAAKYSLFRNEAGVEPQTLQAFMQGQNP